MRFAKPLAVAVIAAATLSVAATPSHAEELDGCVTTYVDDREPYLIPSDAIAEVNGLDIQVHGDNVVAIARYIAKNEAGQAVALVNCIV